MWRGPTISIVESQYFQPRVEEWFQQRFGQPTRVQSLAWPLLQKGESAVVAAPTGSGKTLAAFLPFIDRHLKVPPPPGVQILYVSPLKALSNDVQKNLQSPLAELNALVPKQAPLTVALRTGDSSARERALIVKEPPTILVTTPESLYLLLTAEKGRAILQTVQTVIIDEIHTLARDKRGSHLALSLERLEELCGHSLQRIGLSATARPLSEIGQFLCGGRPHQVLDATAPRYLDLEIITPKQPLSAICSHAMWDEIYEQLIELIQTHQSTLIFVNTRRLAERLAHQLSERMGTGKVTSHHGSLSKEHRLAAEDQLKRGELKAIIATASLELGIDVGAIDLVCQIGSPRSLAGFLQRVGRSGHSWNRTPKGRLIALTRDELIESMALIRAVRRGIIDIIELPEAPLDILAQQIVAIVAMGECDEAALFTLLCRAWPYRNLRWDDYVALLQILSEGFAPGIKRGAYIHYDRADKKLRPRRNARLSAITSGGAIAEQYLFRAVIEGEETVIGTLDEDFALESSRGDIFQLGNSSWQVQGLKGAKLMVKDAGGSPPTIPFWRGEAPGRSFELSQAVSELRNIASQSLSLSELEDLRLDCGLSPRDLEQARTYLAAELAALGIMPSQEKVIWERFFDESGGMQLVIHAPFGTRVNRAWGLALRKRFCRSFDFELQASADDDGIVLSIGPNQGFPLETLFHLLKAESAQKILVQALLDAPLFLVRWRWNVTRALAVLRFRSGKQVPPNLQRFQAQDLLTAAFPAQTQCFEHRTGDVEVPTHPLVQQTVVDCLSEAMDMPRWLGVLQRFESGEIEFIAHDSREPSPFCYERLNANPYSFLDDAPLEERRARAVGMRRQVQPDDVRELGRLDAKAIARVREEAWPLIRDSDELHDALSEMIFLSANEAANYADFLQPLLSKGRAVILEPSGMVVAVQQWAVVAALYPEATTKIPSKAPQVPPLEYEEAILQLLRGRMGVSGPATALDIATLCRLPLAIIEASLAALEASGQIISGHFRGESNLEWCERRLLARIHRLTIAGLREALRPVAPAAYIRFLCKHQYAAMGSHLHGAQALRTVLEQLQGLDLPAAAWESEILTARLSSYQSTELDQLLMTGDFVWGRLAPPPVGAGKIRSWSRDMPIALSPRAALASLLNNQEDRATPAAMDQVYTALGEQGALFLQDLVRASRLPTASVHEALGRLVQQGLVASDHLLGLRPFLGAARRQNQQGPSHGSQGIASGGGRWFRFPPFVEAVSLAQRCEDWAWILLRRWGVLFSELLEHERLAPRWRELVPVLRRLEARGQIRGGRFVTGVGGEQYALLTVPAELRACAEAPLDKSWRVLAGCDPLNLFGVITTDTRVPATRGNRVVVQNGKLIAYRSGGRTEILVDQSPTERDMLERALRLSGVFRDRDPFLREWLETQLK